MNQMTGLEKIANELRAMRPDMERLAGVGDSIKLSHAIELIDTASLEQCKGFIDALTARVSTLCGDASHLEDASDQLQEEINVKNDIDNPPMCVTCNGSGEGQHDGARCRSCKGTGTEKAEA